ncbi:probable cardiolipin synthase (CMP-forming) isoform X1 [Nilaparvata lugens]|uniref:probable cardiolipin synthase (CMP-forming) isoform X1 n=1 Tax=Nilaparvata lugens TaxID=108931 RepID=UPI00193CB31A|nr:probable cardiolipin synthase (CMP-forming) isoform X1 [Nilaparvata lugens]
MAVRLIGEVAESLLYSGAMRPSSLIAHARFRVMCKNRTLNQKMQFRDALKDFCSQRHRFLPNECLFPSAITNLCTTKTLIRSYRNIYTCQNLCYSTCTLRTLSVGFEPFNSSEANVSRFYSSSNDNQNTGSTKDLIGRDLGVKRKEFVNNVLKNNKKKMRLTKIKLQKSGKIILKDIKESKSKMKEKMEEIIERENIWTIPNMLTVLRIAMSPYLGYLICQTNYELALGLVIFAGFTDFLDGIIARSFKNQASKLGSFLDPMADKILIATLFLTLTITGNIPVPLTALIVARDTLLVGAGFYIRYQSLPPPKTLSRYLDVSHATAELAPTRLSKINTTIQLCTVFSTLAAASFGYLEHPVIHGLFWLTAGTTIASAISYIISKDTYKILKRKK